MKIMPEIPETIFSLREKFAAHCRPGTPEQPAIKNICLVGAYNYPNGMPWYELDKLYLNLTLRRLHDNNIAIDPEFEIEIENIDPHQGGKDFLKRTTPADLIVLCFIFNPPAQDAPSFAHEGGAGFYTLSQDHHKKLSWYNAALRVGAKVIAVIGDDHSSEVGPSVFMPANDNTQFVRMNPNEPTHAMNLHVLRHRDFKPLL